MPSSGWRNTGGGHIVTGVSSGAAVRALSAISSTVFLPLAVRYLGAERFGVWATITSTVVFLNLLDLGIASTLTNHMARSQALGDREQAARYTANALALTMLLSVGAAVVLSIVWPVLDWAAMFHVGAGIQNTEVDATVAVAAALVLLGLPGALCSRILAGYQEVHVSNVVIALGTAGNLAGLLVGIALRVSMPALFLMSVGCVPLFNLGALCGTLFWQKPWLRPRMNLLEWGATRELVSSGLGFFLIQIAGAVVFSSDNIVVSHYLGAAQVTPYNVTWRFVGLTAMVQSLLFAAIWPAYADAYARGEYAWMRRTFHFLLRGTLALNLTCAVLFVALGKTFIRWWAGPAAVPSTMLLAAMALWAVIGGCMTVESCLLAAVGRTREQGVLSVVAAMVNLVSSIWLVQRIGAVGVIGGTILSYALVLIVPQSLIVRNILRQQPREEGKQPTQPQIYSDEPTPVQIAAL